MPAPSNRKEKQRLAAEKKRADETAADFLLIAEDTPGTGHPTGQALKRVQRRFARVLGERRRLAAANASLLASSGLLSKQMSEATERLQAKHNECLGLHQALAKAKEERQIAENMPTGNGRDFAHRFSFSGDPFARIKLLEELLDTTEETMQSGQRGLLAQIVTLRRAEDGLSVRVAQLEALDAAKLASELEDAREQIAALTTTLGLKEQQLTDLRIRHVGEAQALGAANAAVEAATAPPTLDTDHDRLSDAIQAVREHDDRKDGGASPIGKALLLAWLTELAKLRAQCVGEKQRADHMERTLDQEVQAHKATRAELDAMPNATHRAAYSVQLRPLGILSAQGVVNALKSCAPSPAITITQEFAKQIIDLLGQVPSGWTNGPDLDLSPEDLRRRYDALKAYTDRLAAERDKYAEDASNSRVRSNALSAAFIEIMVAIEYSHRDKWPNVFLDNVVETIRRICSDRNDLLTRAHTAQEELQKALFETSRYKEEAATLRRTVQSQANRIAEALELDTPGDADLDVGTLGWYARELKTAGIQWSEANEEACAQRDRADKMYAVLRQIADMPEYDQDDHCRMRHFAQQAVGKKASAPGLPSEPAVQSFDDAPFGKPVPDMPGFFYSPFDKSRSPGVVDCRGFLPGMPVHNAGGVFRIPYRQGGPASAKLSVKFEGPDLSAFTRFLEALGARIVRQTLMGRDEKLAIFVLARAAHFDKVWPDDLRLWIGHFHEREIAAAKAEAQHLANSNEASSHPSAIIARETAGAYDFGAECRRRFGDAGVWAQPPFAPFPTRVRPDPNSGSTGSGAAGS